MSKMTSHILEQETVEQLSIENLLDNDPDYIIIMDKYHKETIKEQEKEYE